MDSLYYLEDLINKEESFYLDTLSVLQKNSKHDALAFMLYVLLLECGFSREKNNILPTFNCKRVKEEIEEFQNVLVQKNNVYSLVLYVNKVKCNLDLLVFSKSLISNLSVSEYGILRSKSYKCIDVTRQEQIKSLCIDFKNNIVLPVKAMACGNIFIYYASLLGMPFDILVHLIKHYLNYQDFISLGKTCKKLNNLLDEQSLWIYFCKRESLILDGCETPKNLFKQFWGSKKKI